MHLAATLGRGRNHALQLKTVSNQGPQWQALRSYRRFRDQFEAASRGYLRLERLQRYAITIARIFLLTRPLVVGRSHSHEMISTNLLARQIWAPSIPRSER
jgi:hypothetical protein